ncbi:MAG TPA: DUF883 family protein [Steroidobacteraceae bacterium]|nr:DUF883 family protein [Steroidobacteraceae bacterium]
MNDANRDAMAEELRRIVEQAESLLASAGTQGDAALDSLRARVNDTLGAARARLSDLEQEAHLAGRRAASATESWVRSNPWAALAIGAGIGLIVGAVLSRRSAGGGTDPA